MKLKRTIIQEKKRKKDKKKVNICWRARSYRQGDRDGETEMGRGTKHLQHNTPKQSLKTKNILRKKEKFEQNLQKHLQYNNPKLKF